MAIPKETLEWRERQKVGAIMKPSTFEGIVRGCMKRYGYSKERCTKIAGKAYWETVKAKYKKAKKED